MISIIDIRTLDFVKRPNLDSKWMGRNRWRWLKTNKELFCKISKMNLLFFRLVPKQLTKANTATWWVSQSNSSFSL